MMGLMSVSVLTASPLEITDRYFPNTVLTNDTTILKLKKRGINESFMNAKGIESDK